MPALCAASRWATARPRTWENEALIPGLRGAQNPATPFNFVRQAFVITLEYIVQADDPETSVGAKRQPPMPVNQGHISSNKPAPWDKDAALACIRNCLDREGPLLPILHALQEEFGYIDQAAEPLIAEALNITRAEVHGVITFYHDFRRAPAGRHVLKLCRAEACQAAGGDPLAAHAEARLGVAMGTTAADGSVTLEAVYCLGLCAVAPSAMLDGRVIGRLDQAGLEGLLAETQQ
jgi:formate dehydrogenase subunit gamma